MPDSVASATIVIPQYGRCELTNSCVRSIRAAEDTLWPIVIVDDGSPPEARQELAWEHWDGVDILCRSHGGVTASWNTAIQRVCTPFVVILNNDVIARGPFVERLIAPLQSRTATIAGAAWRIERQLPQELLCRLPTRRFLQGWCLAIATQTLRRLGGFDEDMRLYWSDTDFQLRAIAFADGGTKSLHRVPKLPLEHAGHQTTRNTPDCWRQWQRDRGAFVRKWQMLVSSLLAAHCEYDQHRTTSGQPEGWTPVASVK